MTSPSLPPLQSASARPKNATSSFRWWEQEGEASERLAALLGRLEIVSRRQVESMFAGAYRSAFLGQGMDFAEVRPYQPGDEIRWIDWNVSARMDEIYVKQFVEERERTVFLVWDASLSMELGSHWRSKRELGAELAMILAMSALANNDRVGLLVFSDGIDDFLEPQRTRQHLLRMIQEILTPASPTEPAASSPGATKAGRTSEEEATRPEGAATDLEAALQFLLRVAPRHSIVFFLSDFLVDVETPLWQKLAQRCDVIPLILRDPLEEALPFAGDGEESVWREPLVWGMLSVLVGALCVGVALGGAWLWSAAVAGLLGVGGLLVMGRQRQRGLVLLHEGEADTLRWVDLRAHLREGGDVALPLTPTHQSVHQSFRQMGMDVMDVRTDGEPIRALRSFFQQRQRLSRRR